LARPAQDKATALAGPSWPAVESPVERQVMRSRPGAGRVEERGRSRTPASQRTRMAVRAVASCGDGCVEQQGFGLLGLSAVTPWGYCRRGKRQPSGASEAGYNLARGHAGLTFEVSGRRRWDAKPGPVKMYRVPLARAWWPAVGAALDRGVRPRWAHAGSNADFALH
jgi:hypothetical protein